MGNNLFSYNTKRIRIPDSVEEIGNFLCYNAANDDVSVYTDNPIVLEYLKTTGVTIKPYSEWGEEWNMLEILYYIGMYDKMNKNRGITLIALVVTVIVLIILAGVSISMLTGKKCKKYKTRL